MYDVTNIGGVLPFLSFKLLIFKVFEIINTNGFFTNYFHKDH
jgi:hypothetical protein